MRLPAHTLTSFRQIYESSSRSERTDSGRPRGKCGKPRLLRLLTSYAEIGLVVAMIGSSDVKPKHNDVSGLVQYRRF
jgi:hypothetical protein